MGWANARLGELHAERARLQERLEAVPSEPPVIDRAQLARHLANMPRLLDKATDQEKRELVRRFVAKMDLDPETREVELRLRLPANCAIHVEAAARIVALWIGRCAWCG